MTLIFTCGGTAGHINPAIAVANCMRERHPDCRILFIGATGHMEEKLVPQAGYELKCLPGSGLSRGKNLAALKKNVNAVKCVLSAVKECKKIFREFAPDCIIGTGGYASFPALYAGAQMGIPTGVHESNAVPGLTTKLAASRASRVLVAFEESVQYYKHPEKVEVVGMPVRREFIYTRREDARRELGLSPEEPLVVSAFGSLGAKVMNQTVAELFRLEQENGFPFRHIHATGSFGWEWMPELVKEKGVDLSKTDRIEMREYIYNMPTVMTAADVIISRSGASTCNEIAAAGLPGILIPSPVTNHHQDKNARVLADRSAAIAISEADCTAQRLYDEIQGLLHDPERREDMAKRLREMVQLDSTEQICDIVETLTRR